MGKKESMGRQDVGKVSAQRRRIAREVGSQLIRDAGFGASLPMQTNGDRAIMVVAPNERARSFFARAETIGLPLTIAVRWHQRLHTLHVREVEDAEHVHIEDEAWAIAPSVTMGMVLDALRVKDGSLLLHLEEPENIQVDYEVVGV